MRSRLRRWAIVLWVVFLLVGCTSTTTAVPLPTDPLWKGGCRGVGTDLVIHGSATDPHVTWATSLDGSRRSEILWPVGYTAHFAPTLQVLDETGKVVAREGDRLIGACGGPEQAGPRPPIWVDGADIDPAPSST